MRNFLLIMLFVSMFAVFVFSGAAVADPILTVESKAVNPGSTFNLGVKVDSITDLYAYEFHFNITPLDSQDAGTLAYVQGQSQDIILAKGGSVSELELSDGMAATLLSVQSGVSGLNEYVTNFTFQTTGSAWGDYRVELKMPASLMSDSKLKSIGFSGVDGIVNVVPEPATLTLLGTGLLTLMLHGRRIRKPCQ